MTKGRMVWITCCFPTLLGLSLPSSAGSPAGSRIAEVTLCSLAATPGRFDGATVSVRAHYESDGIEHEGLFDPSCIDSRIALEIPTEAKGQSELRTALHGGHPGTLDKSVTGRFIGTFRWNQNGHPPRSLKVKAMSGFTVSPKAFPSPHPNLKVAQPLLLHK